MTDGKRQTKRKKIWLIILLVILVIVIGLGGYSLYGQHQMKKMETMTFEEMLAYTTQDNSDAVISVGIIRNNEMAYDVYGENGRKLLPEEHSYEIGSLTKTFTTSLLCKAIDEGRVSLDESIDAYLNLDSQNDYPTIQRLVTHSSGYKEYYFETPMIANFLKGGNSFTGISKEMLLNRISKISLKDTDHPFTYSNFGFATLGAVLEEVYDKDYASLMNAYVSEDLGLENTKISDGTGDLDAYWEWLESDAYLPAGALLSNITDMMRYVKLHMSEDLDYLHTAHDELAQVNVQAKPTRKWGFT